MSGRAKREGFCSLCWPWKSSCFPNKTQALSISENLAVSSLIDNKGHFPICHGKKTNLKEIRTVKSCPRVSWTGVPGKGPEASVILVESQESQSEWYSAGIFPPHVQILVSGYSLSAIPKSYPNQRERGGGFQLPLTCTWGWLVILSFFSCSFALKTSFFVCVWTWRSTNLYIAHFFFVWLALLSYMVSLFYSLWNHIRWKITPMVTAWFWTTTVLKIQMKPEKEQWKMEVRTFFNPVTSLFFFITLWVIFTVKNDCFHWAPLPPN